MSKLMKNEKGFTLIEVLVALGLLGIIAVAFLTGIATSSKAILIANERTIAESLARSQMEYVKELDYATSYDPAPIPAEHVGFSATIDVVELAAGLQEITVTIDYYGEVVITSEDYKVNR
jgi:prepilin-type N-terminal cleavage/methylation domain-containing protein